MKVAALLALLVAACGQANAPGAQAEGVAPPVPGAPDDRIECRAAGAVGFERVCSVASADSPRGRVLTIRKADGGFRRLLITRDGIAAADGAARATATTLADNRIEVEIGGDRFRLPATAR